MSSMPPSPFAPPSEQTSEGPKAPPPGRKFPCAKCGAKLDFDPASRSLQCPYCGHKEIIEPSSYKVQEHDFEAQMRQSDGGGVLAGRSSQVRCTACNAIVLLEDNV